MTRLLASAVAAAAVVSLTMPAPASANTIDKLAFLTFSAPVQIPGATLDAGTYQFRLANPGSGRDVFQVLSHDGSVLYSMFFTLGDNRTVLTEDPVVTFIETPAGVPPAVRSLFYPGEYRGYQFVWGKGEPNMIPKVVEQPPITYTAIPEAKAAEPAAPVAAPLVAEEAPAAEPELTAEAPVAPAEAPAPAELPRTASPLPLLALGGFSSLLTGLGLGLRRRR